MTEMAAVSVDLSSLHPGQWVTLRFAEPGHVDLGRLTEMARDAEGLPSSLHPVQVDSINTHDGTFIALTPRGFLVCTPADIASIAPDPRRVAEVQALMLRPDLAHFPGRAHAA